MKPDPRLPLPFVIAIIGLATLLAGCESTGSSLTPRIQEHSETFASLDPATQQRIKQGVIHSGDTTDMVYMAVGQPDEVEVINQPDGSRYEIWHYLETVQEYVSEETVAYEDHSDYNIHTGQRIHYKLPVREKVYHNVKRPGFQLIVRNDQVISLHGNIPTESVETTAAD